MKSSIRKNSVPCPRNRAGHRGKRSLPGDLHLITPSQSMSVLALLPMHASQALTTVYNVKHSCHAVLRLVGLVGGRYGSRTSGRIVAHRIMEHEQPGPERAAYGPAPPKKPARDLTARLGRGFSEHYLDRCVRSTWLGQIRRCCLRNPFLLQFRRHCLRNLGCGPSLACLGLATSDSSRVADDEDRAFCEWQALYGGSSDRQLDRPIAR